MRKFGLGLILASPLAIAADGSWSNQSFGGTITRENQTLKSKPVQSPSPLSPGTVATRVYWKINTSGPTPAGFRIRLCSAMRCLKLPGLAGEMALFADIPAGGPFRFEYASPKGGTFNFPLTVMSNQMTVSYSSQH